jgi:nucleoside-diphosphate-sugar epimerase
MIYSKNPESNRIIREDMDGIVAANLPWQQLRNKKIIVAGGGGFLGSYLVKALLTANAALDLNLTVTCLTRNVDNVVHRFASWQNDSALKFFEHDIVQALPPELAPAHIVVHTASQATPRHYEEDPVGTLLANSVGTRNLLDYAIRSESKKFLFFSSGAVYGTLQDNSQEVPETEYGPIDPLDMRACYSESKRIAETMCVAWSHQYGLDTSIVRPAHTYGPGLAANDGRSFADFIADAVAGRNIKLKSNGSARRVFCYVADATLGFLTVMFHGDDRKAYNVANPMQEVSIGELAEIVAALAPHPGVRVERISGPAAKWAFPASFRRPSIDAIKSLGWSPTTGVSEGFRRAIEADTFEHYRNTTLKNSNIYNGRTQTHI